MKRYVIQTRRFRRDPWEVMPGREYSTLEEARAVFGRLPFRENCRIAEAYTQVRYKAVKQED